MFFSRYYTARHSLRCALYNSFVQPVLARQIRLRTFPQIMPASKRKRVSVDLPSVKRRASTRSANPAVADPTLNTDILDAPNALRATPDGDMNEDLAPGKIKQDDNIKAESPLSDAPHVVEPVTTKKSRKLQKTSKAKAASTNGSNQGYSAAEIKTEDVEDDKKQKKNVSTAKKQSDDAAFDPEAEEDEDANEEEIKEALARPPPVNSDYLPLPWKGRLGYACLNTYLRQSNPPVFSSRTCRIQSILEHRHPLQDPSQPEHPTKNRPDRTKPADIELGQKYVESICLANVKDIAKMIRWNDKYNIKFMRLSSEMFPFASHPEYGYGLAGFASDALAEAGRVIAQHGHRVTTHPGQFTQLGSPRKSVIDNAFRDLEYHDEMLSLLRLPDQLNRDAVMILHMGGMFEGKAETLQRFRENYVKLSQSIKNRLVLENDDVGWSVHDLLPVCEEFNIPMVLDYHHHNIVFDASQIREGTKDIMDLYPRIKATWDRKSITQKMHYSEPTPPAITPRQRRKHNPRVATLPPCADTMDLMIEAKDKEQAVFELMRTFKLPGYDTFSDILPYTRNDDNKQALAQLNKKPSKKPEAEDAPVVTLVPEEDVGMGGPEGRVYWPPGMEEWLRPKKREVKKKEPIDAETAKKTKAQLKKEATEIYEARKAEKEALAQDNGLVRQNSESDPEATPATKKAKAAMRKKERAQRAVAHVAIEPTTTSTGTKGTAPKSTAKAKSAGKPKAPRKKLENPAVLTPSTSEDDGLEQLGLHEDEDSDNKPITPVVKRARGAAAATGSRQSGGRRAKSKTLDYTEQSDEA